jgi:hypothetical protein
MNEVSASHTRVLQRFLEHPFQKKIIGLVWQTTPFGSCDGELEILFAAGCDFLAEVWRLKF